MKHLYCIACPNGCLLTLAGTGMQMIVEGGKCDKGQEFAKAEMTDPTRTLTTTVRTRFPDVPVISVRTDGEIPKDKIPKAMEEINKVIVEEELAIGDIVIEEVADTDINVIITSPALMQIGQELENKSAELERLSPGGGGGGSSGSADFDPAEDSSNLSHLEGTAGEVLDDLGEDHLGGFVGAAGEAVGVDDPDEEGTEDAEDGTDGDGTRSGDPIPRKSRARIGR